MAGADNDAFAGSAHGALRACSPRIELDPIISHDLTVERGIARACDLSAQPAFHYAFVVAIPAVRHPPQSGWLGEWGRLKAVTCRL